jgi:hypothetical protein
MNFIPSPKPTFRCAGPNCGVLKGQSNHWWLMWTSQTDDNTPVVSLCPWDDRVAEKGDALPVCGELCAQKLQSQFMGNVVSERRGVSNRK